MARDGGAGVGALVGGGLVLVAAIVIGAFVARMLSAPSGATTASSVPAKPTYIDHGPMIDPSASGAARPPLAFNDPENAARYDQAKILVDALGKTVGAIATAKDDAGLDEAKTACQAADKQMAFLGGEPHPTVKEVVETEHRLCEYQRPLSALTLILSRIRVARKSGGKRPDALCKRGEEIALEIHSGHYQDDPAMLLALEELGKQCV